MCFMIHEILKYENIFILMEKMGKQYSQNPLKSPTMFRKYCVGVGEEGDVGLPDTNYFLSKIFFVHSYSSQGF